MTERPTTVGEWEAAVRELRENYLHLSTPVCRNFCDDLAALLPPAKERVPWWEAKGRTVDGREVIGVRNDGNGPCFWFVGSSARAAADGMVEVDVR